MVAFLRGDRQVKIISQAYLFCLLIPVIGYPTADPWQLEVLPAYRRGKESQQVSGIAGPRNLPAGDGEKTQDWTV